MPDSPPPPLPPPKKHGCFFYGCIASVVLLALLVVGIFLAARYALGSFVTNYTDTAPMTLPKSDLPPDQLKQLLARFDAFEKAAQAHTNTAPLTLTGPEANALLASAPELKPYKDEFFVDFSGDQTKAQISLPLDSVHVPMLNTKGRYLNGKGTFTLAVSNGLLSATVDSLEVKGRQVPAEFLASLRQQNLAQGINSNTNSPLLRQFESVQVKDGLLIITPKTN